MELSVLQNILREAVIQTLAGQLQPYMGPPHLRLPGLHCLQVGQDLQWHEPYPHEMVVTALGGAVTTTITLGATIA